MRILNPKKRFIIFFPQPDRLAGKKYPLEIAYRVRACNKNIEKTLRLVKDMLEMANAGDEDRDDVGCGVLYGILRDAAFRIKKVAEAEKTAHMAKGKWD